MNQVLKSSPMPGKEIFTMSSEMCVSIQAVLKNKNITHRSGDVNCIPTASLHRYAMWTSKWPNPPMAVCKHTQALRLHRFSHGPGHIWCYADAMLRWLCLVRPMYVHTACMVHILNECSRCPTPR